MGNINREELMKCAIEFWYKTDKELPNLGERSSLRTKIKQQREMNKFIKGLSKKIKEYPNEQIQCERWKTNFRDYFEKFLCKSILLTKKEMDLLFSYGIFEITKLFIEEARSTDEYISIENIGQAMRNVWIMNIAQAMLDREVQYTSSIFGYSMLYPYTDNYLDDEDISVEDKKVINTRFEKRLRGEEITPLNNHEKKLFSMVEKIEMQYERKDYSKVYESLILIHEGQMNSLLQQRKNMPPYENDILGISFFKGGSSVLADAYLIAGDLKSCEEQFFFLYGVLLQLCDDLQDVKEDSIKGHNTIFSQTSKGWKIDLLTNKVMNFLFDLFEQLDFINNNEKNEIRKVIEKNCLLLIYFSISKNSSLYSRAYIKDISKYLPLRMSYMRKLRKRLHKEYRKLNKNMNSKMLEEILVYAFS